MAFSKVVAFSELGKDILGKDGGGKDGFEAQEEQQVSDPLTVKCVRSPVEETFTVLRAFVCL